MNKVKTRNGARVMPAYVTKGAVRRNVNEDNFDDCFRYWEIRRFGGDYKDPPSLLSSKTPSSESK